MRNVVLTLKNIITSQQNDIIIDTVYEEEIDILDINNDLTLENKLDNYKSESNSSLPSQPSVQSNLLDPKINVSIQTNLSSYSFDLASGNMIDEKFVTVIIKKHDKGHTFNQM